MPTLDYQVNLRSKTRQRLIAEALATQLRENRYDPATAREAEDLVVEFVQQLLNRKRNTPEENASLREQFGVFIR